MNIKNYLKGIGVGIIVASLILIIAGKLNNNTMSDEDVIKRAKELGMVESTTLTAPSGNTGLVEKTDKAEDITQVTDEAAKNEEDKKEETDVSKDNSSDNKEDGLNSTAENKADSTSDNKADSTDNKTETKEDKTDKTDTANTDKSDSSNITDKTDTKNTTDNKTVATGDTVKVEVKSGMSSESAAAAAKDAGLVDDDVEFNKYLCANGYDKRLRVGQYDIPTGSDFETIAKFLCG